MSYKGKIEIMSPAGSYESLMAAIQGGAGSIYFGAGKLNMRSRSSANFSLDDISNIADICRQNGVKSYLTLNTIVYDNELEEIKSIIETAKQSGISAIIASDISVIQYARQIGVEIHISTQCNITNIEAVKFYSQFADVMVLARELSIKQVKEITTQIKEQDIRGPKGELVQIEVFVHGALCMAVSGKCYLSLHNHNLSANRGACLQDCRRAYRVYDKDSEVELEIDNEYIMSPKDLKTVQILDKILDAGVTVLKIEGRGRSPEYVKTVTQCYNRAVEAYFNDNFNEELVEDLNKKLSSVYNRGFWEGYYMGAKLGEWTERHGSSATHKKVYVGKVINFYNKIMVAQIKVDTYDVSVNEDLIVIGPTTGVYELHVEKMLNSDDIEADKINKGETFTISTSEILRRNDDVYKIVLNQ
ncbi:MAG: U32 family peptidase [Lentimicrobiaceae bacterium]|nr:U32 family peptidase [Lentimicrobiaceae bacterium]